MMRRLMAIGLMGLLATVLATAPLGASASVDVDVRSNGDLIITGDNDENRVSLCQVGETSYRIDVFEEAQTDPVHSETAEGVTRHIRFNMRGGIDHVDVGCGELMVPFVPETNPITHIHGDLTILGGSQSDSVTIHDTHVEDDLSVQLNAGQRDTVEIVYVKVSDDAMIRGQGGADVVSLTDLEVSDLLNVITGSGEGLVFIDDSWFGRSIVRTGTSNDHVEIDWSYLGVNPQILTAANVDNVRMHNSLADGRLTVNTGSGADTFDWTPPGQDMGTAFTFNVILGAGNDFASFGHIIGPGDLINCGSGSMDAVQRFLDEGARFTGCEFVGDLH